MPDSSRTIKLRPYQVYPTYQLWALLGSSGQAGGQDEPRLVRAICKTYSWLQDRFREQDLPDELVLPEEPQQLADFRSFSIFEGFQIEALCLAGLGSWSIRLVEADLGSGGGQAGQLREAVPGRLFYTDIAFRLLADRVEAGIRVQVSEPSGPAQDCPVYRPAIVRWLAEDPEIGLSYACERPLADDSPRPLWPVGSEPLCSEDRSLVTSIQAWLQDPLSAQPLFLVTEDGAEDQPVSEFAEPAETAEAIREAAETVRPLLRELDRRQAGCRDFLSEPLPLQNRERLSIRLSWLGRGRKLERSRPAGESDWPREEWIRRLASKQLGYGPVLKLNPAQRIQLNSRTGLQVQPDSLTLIQPAAAEETLSIQGLSFAEIALAPGSYLQQLSDLVRNRLRGEAQSFRDVLLPDESREQQMSVLPAEDLPAETQLDEALTTIEQLGDQLRKLQQRHRAEVTGIKGSLSEMKRRLKDAESNYTDLQGHFAHEQEKLQLALKRADEEKRQLVIRNGYLMSLEDRPRSYDGIAPWMEQYSSQVILHERAKDQLSKLAPNTVDLTLLADALEYLSKEWLDWRRQTCTEAERDQQASWRYGRRFDVSLCDGRTVEMFSDEYHVTYHRDRLQLNLHLKVGNRSPNLLRIYFCELPADGRLLIGSLPGHLPTLSDPH